MEIFSATTEAIAAGARRLRDGEIVAFPTETVYGLGADARNGEAVARIFAAKGRPAFNPLIVHVLDAEAAMVLAEFSPVAKMLVEAFWPGPLTIVARRLPSNIADLTTAGLATIALRSPRHPVARALMEAAEMPIAAPSANISGHVSATTAEHVAEDLGAHVAMLLDGGPTALGLESTIIDTTGDEPVLLRPGSIETGAIATVIGRPIRRRLSDPHTPHSPGQLRSHYSPGVRVRLNAAMVNDDEALLAFGPETLPTTGPVFNLSHRGDLIEAAAALFAGLRALDSAQVRGIAVMPIPMQGLGEAINDRLARAAADVQDRDARERTFP